MRDFVSWNLTKGRRNVTPDDVFFISFPKSGRTWVRVFYFAYLAKMLGREFSVETKNFPGRPVPCFTHDRWDHRRRSNWWDFIRGKRLVPSKARRENKIVLLARDPRDVVVSLHFHLTKRRNTYQWTPQPMSEMLRNPDFGLTQVIGLMNGWLEEWHGRPGFKLMRYEDCKADTANEFRRLLAFLGQSPVDESAFAHALEFSRFENMQKAEATGQFKEKFLSAPDQTDQDSFKARRGKVGGFCDYFSADDLAYAAEQLQQLDPRFGYPVTSSS